VPKDEAIRQMDLQSTPRTLVEALTITTEEGENFTLLKGLPLLCPWLSESNPATSLVAPKVYVGQLQVAGAVVALNMLPMAVVAGAVVALHMLPVAAVAGAVVALNMLPVAVVSGAVVALNMLPVAVVAGGVDAAVAQGLYSSARSTGVVFVAGRLVRSGVPVLPGVRSICSKIVLVLPL
jgi:hypothetical protein